MKIVRYIFPLIAALFLFSCTESIMDEVNQDLNNTTAMDAKNLLPDAILKSAFETTGTDLAWYATVYVEHSAGTWAQSADADKRIGQNSASMANNSWNNIYNVLTICKTIINKTDPGAEEFDNYWTRGIAQLLAAYNLAVATDMWGEVPWTEACLGNVNLKPSYERQSEIYGHVFNLLDSAIFNINRATLYFGDKDYIYGTLTLANNKAAWIRAANSLKARYYMRLSQRDPQAATKALAVIPLGFTDASQGLIFNKYEASLGRANPWWEFRYYRAHLSVSSTLLSIMNDRNDPRRAAYFTLVGGNFVGAPSGTAAEVQSGTYSRSIYTAANTVFCMTQPTPMITYHELKFIEAEAKFRSGDVTYNATLQQAVEASFVAKGLTLAQGTTYYTDEVAPRLTTGNELNEIMIQKYIAMYEAEAMESYNDYRRTGIPTMNNPNNATVGFVHRFPFALSEYSSNSANTPECDVHTDRVWWAGGNDLF